MTRRPLVLLFLSLTFAGAARGAESSPETAARHAWAVSDVVLDKHIDPPSRQEMFLYALKALRSQTGKAPADLGRRVSAVTSEADLAALFREAWPAKDAEELALRGALWPVPGRAHVFAPKEYRRMEQIAGNRYEGTGIQVRMHQESKLVQVMHAFPGGPARRAGMRADDLIEAVDDVDCRGKSLQAVVEMISGNAGAPVTLAVRQPNSAEKRILKMVRDVIPFETVTGLRRTGETGWQFRIDPREPIAFLRVRSLSSSTLSELRKIERQLQDDGCRAVVLDLRFANGGDARHAALLADALLDGGTLWKVYDRRGDVKEVKADRDCLFRGWPVAVLVNEFTRNTGADFVAAALQDGGRAALVGEPTRGDGLLRTFEELPHGLGMLHLPTAAVERVPTKHTPKAPAEPIEPGSPRVWPVRPDHVVPLAKEKASAVELWHQQEERAHGADKSGPRPDDPQLNKAVEVVRAALKPPASP